MVITAYAVEIECFANWDCLLELCAAAFLIAQAKVPSLRMVPVAGPRPATAGLQLPGAVEVRGSVPTVTRFPLEETSAERA